MVSLGGGRWLKELALSPGVYEYRLVVDGGVDADPRARETAAESVWRCEFRIEGELTGAKS